LGRSAAGTQEGFLQGIMFLFFPLAGIADYFADLREFLGVRIMN
jgi:hypothetical protein